MTAGEHRLTLDASKRMTRKSDFDRAFAARCASSNPLLTLYVAPNEHLQARVGLAVGRRHGNAVRRNRIRRLLREAFRLEQHRLTGGFDYLLVPKAIPNPQLASYRTSLVQLGRGAVRRWQTRAARLLDEGDQAGAFDVAF